MTTPTRPARGATDLDIVRAELDEHYEVLRELGRGGMAIVYKARERKLDREVAIKVLPFTLAFDDSLVERFMREARTAARLEHPHIIPIHRVGQAGQVTYFVMKLMRGQSLSDRLLERGPMPAEETRRVLLEIAGALGYAHRHGVVHRDIKPDNILLDEDGRCIVTDFGIARSGSESKLTATGMSLGTPRYMSPEQARAKAVDGRSDIYSLGVVGYECLVGHPPFEGSETFELLMAHITNPVPRPSLDGPEARALYAVIERMLAKSPEDRFESGEELVAALRGEVEVKPLRISGDTVAVAAAQATARTPATLERTIAAGAGLLKEQRPKIEAGVAAARSAWDAHAPRARAAAGRVLDRAGALVARLRDFEGANRRRVWSLAAAVAALGLGGYWGGHFALHHRSKCPAASATSGERAAATPAFSLLLDDGGSIPRNGEAEVYYDVCGLAESSDFTTRIVVSRQESGFRRLFGGGVEPVTARFEDRAAGPATRRHRTIDLDGMPAGTYRVSVLVTDARGRKREKGTSLRVKGGGAE